MKSGNIDHAEKLLNQVINSMEAYIDAQVVLSNKTGNIDFVKPEKIIESYITNLKERNSAENETLTDIIDSMQETLDKAKKDK